MSKKFKLCDGFGNRRKINGIITGADFEYYYINYYYCKSTEEFINKLMRTDAVFKNTTKINLEKINKEKLDLIENRTKINLTKFRINLKI